MEPHNEPDELKDAPLLRSIPRTDPFVVPEGFFERFPHQVQARIAAQRRSGLHEWIADRRLVLRFAGAAAVLILVATAAFFALQGTAPVNDQIAEGITIAPYEIDPGMIDEADLIDLIGDGPELMAEAGAGFSQAELAAYITHEELPLDLLIEEL